MSEKSSRRQHRALVGAIRTEVDKPVRFPLIGRPGAYADTRELVVHRNHIVTHRIRADEVQMPQVWHSARQRR